MLSCNDVDGDELEEANLDDDSSQFIQREEGEDFEDKEEFIFEKTASKKIKPSWLSFDIGLRLRRLERSIMKMLGRKFCQQNLSSFIHVTLMRNPFKVI